MLEIKKTGVKNFTHYWITSNKTFKYEASDLTIISNDDITYLRSLSGRVVFEKNGFVLTNIRVYDVGGSAETFATTTALHQRLIDLGYPAYYVDGEIVLSDIISGDSGNDLTIGTDGGLFVNPTGVVGYRETLDINGDISLIEIGDIDNETNGTKILINPQTETVKIESGDALNFEIDNYLNILNGAGVQFNRDSFHTILDASTTLSGNRALKLPDSDGTLATEEFVEAIETDLQSQINIINSNKITFTFGEDFYDLDTESLFFDSSNWTPQNNGGTTPVFDNVSTFHKFSNLSLRFGDTTDGATTTFGKRLSISEPIDLSEQDTFSLWVYVDGDLVNDLKDASLFGSILFVAGDLNFVNAKGVNIFGTGGGSFNKGWNNITVNKNDFSINLSGSFDWTSAQSFQFRITKNTYSLGTLFHFDSIFFGGKNDYKTPVCITLDDSHKDSYKMAKIMNKYGIPTSIFVIPDFIDDHETYSIYLTLEQTKHLYNQGNHIGFHHQDFCAFSVNPTLINDTVNWLISNGFTRNNGHLYGSYPNGSYSQACIDYAKSIGVKSIRSLTGTIRDDAYNREATKGLIHYESIANGGIADNFRVNASKPVNLADFTSKLETSKNKRAGYLTYHHLFSEFTNEAEWELLAQGLKSQVDAGEIECLTYPEFIKKYES